MRAKRFHLLAGLILLVSAFAPPANAVAIDSYFTVNPIRVCDNAGQNCPTVNTFFPEIAKIYTQAGVQPIFLPITQINSTASQIVPSVTTVNVPGNGQSANSTVVNMWFVKQMTAPAGMTLYGEAAIGGNGVAINTTDVNRYNSGNGRIDTVAHEIGHNLGLTHSALGAGVANNLMSNGDTRSIPTTDANITPDGTKLDQLTAAQITQIRSSALVKQKPNLIVDTQGSTPFDTNNFFRVNWQGGSSSTYLHSMTMNLAPVNAFFDPTDNPPGIGGSPFATSGFSGLAPGNITVSGETDGNQLLTLTFADNTFNPGDFFSFGIDIDLFNCIDCFGVTPEQLAGAQFAFNFSDGLSVAAGLSADFNFQASTLQPSALYNGAPADPGGPVLPPGTIDPPDYVPSPEPATIGLFTAGLAMLALLRRRRAATI